MFQLEPYVPPIPVFLQYQLATQVTSPRALFLHLHRRPGTSYLYIFEVVQERSYPKKTQKFWVFVKRQCGSQWVHWLKMYIDQIEFLCDARVGVGWLDSLMAKASIRLVTQWSWVWAPAAALSSNSLGQVVHTHVPLSPVQLGTGREAVMLFG